MKNYEALGAFVLQPADLIALLETQNECTLGWLAPDGWPVAATMRYIWRDGRFWMTSTEQRPRVAAVRNDERVSVVVSSLGTSCGPMWSASARGRCRVLRGDDVPGDFLAQWAAHDPYLGDDPDAYIAMLDSPGRVALVVDPCRWTTFDGVGMIASTNGVMALR